MQFLVIEGNIGAGKTTLARMLAEDLNAKLILEQFEENAFLPKFYSDPERYSFPLELSFLASRYNQIKKEIMNLDLFHPLTIADYVFFKTAIFAQNTLKPDEYRLFRQIFNMVSENIPKPQLCLYLHAETEHLLYNIKKRGRAYEQEISADYLQKISEGYFSYLKQIISFPVLLVDVSRIDFVQNRSHYEILKRLLLNNNYKMGINQIMIS